MSEGRSEDGFCAKHDELSPFIEVIECWDCNIYAYAGRASRELIAAAAARQRQARERRKTASK